MHNCTSLCFLIFTSDLCCRSATVRSIAYFSAGDVCFSVPMVPNIQLIKWVEENGKFLH